MQDGAVYTYVGSDKIHQPIAALAPPGDPKSPTTYEPPARGECAGQPPVVGGEFRTGIHDLLVYPFLKPALS